LSGLKDKTCVENQTVRFEIELNKPDLMDGLKWFKDGKELDLNDPNIELKSIGNKYMLCIKKAQFEDDGQYEVKIADSDLSSSGKLLVEEAPLEFIRHLGEIELRENQTAVFECELNKPNEKVKWFKNGEPIEIDGVNVIAKSDGKVHQLIIKKCDLKDAAKYTCKTAGPTSSAAIYVEEIPVEFITKLENVKVKEKETATFTCTLNKENASGVKWFKGGLEILPDETKYKYITDGNKYSLQILDCKLDDISDYAIMFRGRKCAASLDVEEVPSELVRPLQDVTVYEKQEISLECEFSEPNYDQVLWQKDNVDVKYALGSDRFTKRIEGNVYKLVVYEAKLEDLGSYSCTVKKTKTTCNVKVLEKPVEFLKKMEDQEVVEKQKATFVCTLSKPRLKVTWYKGDKKLKENDRIQFAQEGKVYKLIIDNCALDDAGAYTCKYEPDNIESSAELHVKEAPISMKTKLEDKTAIEDDLEAYFEVECSKKISSRDEIKWMFNSRKIDLDLQDQKYRMQLDGKLCRLVIKSIKLEDEGNYSIDINENHRSTAKLTVNELPVKFVKPLIDLTGKEDEAVSFECEISKAEWKKTGKEIIVRWFKGERELRDTSKYTIRKNDVKHTLEVKDLAFEDIFEYSAVVGEEKTKARLDINGKNLLNYLF
jgi:titin